ncbi:hypothetical protein BDA96_01G198000 [Sorghum bicolor]|uniref:Uncharacterized protein n=2 Tax=Sorghum bicolor TaxID=4558 RepID=A0A921RZV1_SORBI|nr:hypothetical protein BDA96_01G198000 [Sorghum bicolor]OQU79025.1 hypothetical protein SORBI_3008G088839 [Sorghum bicolor]
MPPLRDLTPLVQPSTGRRSSTSPWPPCCRPIPTAHHRSGHFLVPCCCASAVMSSPTRLSIWSKKNVTK